MEPKDEFLMGTRFFKGGKAGNIPTVTLQEVSYRDLESAVIPVEDCVKSKGKMG